MSDFFGLRGADIAAFCKWAFGPDVILKTFPKIHHMKLWNARHADLLVLKPDGSPNVDIIKMIDLWRKHGM